MVVAVIIIVCMPVCRYGNVCASAWGGQRHLIPWSWTYRRLWAVGAETELGSYTRAVPALSHHTITSPKASLCCLDGSWTSEFKEFFCLRKCVLDGYRRWWDCRGSWRHKRRETESMPWCMGARHPSTWNASFGWFWEPSEVNVVPVYILQSICYSSDHSPSLFISFYIPCSWPPRQEFELCKVGIALETGAVAKMISLRCVWAGDTVHSVECLTNKCEAPGSVPSTTEN